MVNSLDYQSKTDLELVNVIKLNNDSDALCTLQERHGGMINSIFDKYKNNLAASGCLYNDLLEQAPAMVYQAATTFNPEKQVKVTTWLYNTVKFNILNKLSDSNPPFVNIEPSGLNNFPDEKYETRSKSYGIMNEVMDFVSSLDDKRIEVIFKERYAPGRKETWKNIGKKVGLTAQGCLNVHNKVCKRIKERLRVEL